LEEGSHDVMIHTRDVITNGMGGDGPCYVPRNVDYLKTLRPTSKNEGVD